MPVKYYKNGEIINISENSFDDIENIKNQIFHNDWFKFYTGKTSDKNTKNLYYHLGFIEISDQGQTAVINYYGGAGQNGRPDQNTTMRVIIKKAWDGEADNKRYGISVECYANYKNEQIIAKFKPGTKYTGVDLWVYCPYTHAYAIYTVEGNFYKYEPVTDPGNDYLTEAPTEGTDPSTITYYKFVTSENALSYREYACLYTYGEPTTYNLKSGHVQQLVSFAVYYGNSNNKYFINAGNGHSIKIASSASGLNIKIHATVQINNSSKVARELFASIRINGVRKTENYITSTSNVPKVFIQTELPFYKCKGNETIDLVIYSNKAGKVAVECNPDFLKTFITVEQIY